MLTAKAKLILIAYRTSSLNDFARVFWEQLFDASMDYNPYEDLTAAEVKIFEEIYVDIELLDSSAKTPADIEEPGFSSIECIESRIRNTRFVERLEELDKIQIL